MRLLLDTHILLWIASAGDRLLVAQAQAEELTIMTADPSFATYGVDVLW